MIIKIMLPWDLLYGYDILFWRQDKVVRIIADYFRILNTKTSNDV